MQVRYLPQLIFFIVPFNNLINGNQLIYYVTFYGWLKLVAIYTPASRHPIFGSAS
ncbi:hypothetical protein BV133_504 [Blastochloris viridis]|uniref:Uncharacterized protein n=1 Tax=Blastochloris viridis TaxID=1079 RepID=A0A182CZ75_BLAVI|nr:hypothetical protein BV133_504 [Blastochloris viridis]